MAIPLEPRYRLVSPLTAVRVEARYGSSLKETTDTLVKIPAGALVEPESSVTKAGLLNIRWNGASYSVFHEDLQAGAELVAVSAE